MGLLLSMFRRADRKPESSQLESWCAVHASERAHLHPGKRFESENWKDIPLVGAGLALSGGGIRSATFGLGVLQALARAGKLSRIDYMSTVSGGGYIGAWLTAWIHRSGLQQVEKILGDCDEVTGAGADKGEPPEVTWLRRYSNYLAPRLGLLSLDSLTLLATWGRNVALNLTILFAAFAALLVLPRALLPLFHTLGDWAESLACMWAIAFFYFVVLLYLNLKLQDNRLRGFFIRLKLVPVDGTGFGSLRAAQTRAALQPPLGNLAAFNVACGVFSCSIGGLFLYCTHADTFQRIEIWFAIGMAGALVVLVYLWLYFETRGRLRRALQWRHLKAIFVEARYRKLFWLAAAGAMSIAFAWIVLRQFNIRFVGLHKSAPAIQTAADILVFGPATVTIVFVVSGWLFIGLAGPQLLERSREWWSRLLSAMATASFVLFAWGALAFYVPALVHYGAYATRGWLNSAALAGWVGSILGALIAARSKPRSAPARNLVRSLGGVFAIIGVVGIVVIASLMVHLALNPTAPDADAHVESASPTRPEASDPKYPAPDQRVETLVPYSMPPVRLADFNALYFRQTASRFDEQVSWASATWVLAAFGASLIVFFWLGWRVDVNQFSLHNTYRVRLSRCYLGASRKTRKPNSFTGFDEDDDIRLCDAGRDSKGNPVKPMQIINTALNLTIGEDLALQSQKSASFTFSSEYCGYELTDRACSKPGQMRSEKKHHFYRKTSEYGDAADADNPLSLAAAVATSGAAVSPNMGRYSNPALSFLLTLISARLGRWTENTRNEKMVATSPRFGPQYLLRELFGFANDEARYVYLSDGGHFENLGLYELVRRRCKTIICVDATADPRGEFGDLANAIRQVRLDFGVEIELDTSGLMPDAGGFSAKACAIGTMVYPSKGRKRDRGILVYLKPTKVRSHRSGESPIVPSDVLSYAMEQSSFPHQSTADQFFTEAQFESYRALGFSLTKDFLRTHSNLLSALDLTKSRSGI